MSKRIQHRLIVLLAWWCSIAGAQRATSFGFLFLPFKNNSDFAGKWQLQADVPRYLAAYVKSRYGVATVSPIVVLGYVHQENMNESALNEAGTWKQLRDQFGIRFLVSGSVERFDVSRFTTGTQALGGYEAYKGEVTTDFAVYDLDRLSTSATADELFKSEVTGEFADRSLALTLLGKPTARTVEFRDLDRIPFGSEEFNRTVIGRACLQLAEHVALRLEESFPMLKSKELLSADSLVVAEEIEDSAGIFFHGRVVTGSIVFVEGGDIFANIGSEDGIRKGQSVAVYAEEMVVKDSLGVAIKRLRVKKGDLEVVEVRGPHLSLCRVKTKSGEIRRRDKVQARVIE